MLGKYSFGFAGLGRDVDPELIAEKEKELIAQGMSPFMALLGARAEFSPKTPVPDDMEYGMPPVHAGPTAAGKTWSAGTLAGILIAAGILGVMMLKKKRR